MVVYLLHFTTSTGRPRHALGMAPSESRIDVPAGRQLVDVWDACDDIAAAVMASVGRYFAEPLKRKHTRRVAHQALEFVALED